VAELTGDEPELRVGDSGEGVVLLQVRLYGLGMYRTVPDGTFDMSTENAVRELQSTLGQDNDGTVGRQTWEAILHLEQQYGIQYQYHSPYDALSQIQYDLAHPNQGGQWGADGVWHGDGTDGYSGQLSPDGQWRWDGYEWRPAQAGDGGDGYGSAADAASGTGQLSADGQWRWDGADWQPVSADSYLGQLSADGQWRWDGSQWQAA